MKPSYEEALKAYEGALSPFDGSFYSDKWGTHFKGDNALGRWFEISINENENYISISADMHECGMGVPCSSLEEITRNTLSAIEWTKAKRKEVEQLKLF